MIQKPYKQEARCRLFSIYLPASACASLMGQYFTHTYQGACVFIKGSYGVIYLDETAMEKVAKEFLEKATEDAFPAGWIEEWERLDREIPTLARQISLIDLKEVSTEELLHEYEKLIKLQQDMWAISIFVDVFDAGHDQATITKRQVDYALSEDEVHTLLSPQISSYVTAWQTAAHVYKNGELSFESLRDEFFWYGTDYAQFNEMTPELASDLTHEGHIPFVSPKEDQDHILKKHGLSHNPLGLFSRLIEWRDQRKRFNFTGVHALLRIAREICARKGIDPELAWNMVPLELPQVVDGSINAAYLEKRNQPVLVVLTPASNDIAILVGKDAVSLFNELQQLNTGEKSEVVKGMVASRGKATGKVCIVLNPYSEEAKKMEQGDILVTSMTRPEFVVLMKKAGAVITNEGGISSHAAIVSRELGIPCIIGTKNATEVFQDGDLVEVDAFAGVAKKVEA